MSKIAYLIKRALTTGIKEVVVSPDPKHSSLVTVISTGGYLTIGRDVVYLKEDAERLAKEMAKTKADKLAVMLKDMRRRMVVPVWDL